MEGQKDSPEVTEHRPMADMERARESILMRMKCLHCFRPHQDPRQIPCGHTFCLQCLEQIHSSSTSLGSFSSQRTSLSYLKKGGGFFLCPTCSTLVTVPAQGVVAFPQAESVDDVKKSAIDELSQLLEIKYRRRTTGNIGQREGNFSKLSARSGVDLLIEENEDESHDAKNIHNRHSYPNTRLGNTLDCIDQVIDYESNKPSEDQTASSKLDQEESFERNRRSRRSNRNLKSNLRPTSEYSDDVSLKTPQKERNNVAEFSDEFQTKKEDNDDFKNDNNDFKDDNNDFKDDNDDFKDEMNNSRSYLTGSRSYSTLDRNRSYVSTARRCFSLRDKIKREPTRRYSDVIDPTNQDASSRFSSFPSSSRSSFESRRPFSSSFDSANGNEPSSYSDVGYSSTSHAKPESSRYKSAPENFYNFSYKPQNGSRRSFRNYSNGFTTNPDNNIDENETAELKDSKYVEFTEEEIKERLSKYRETAEDYGSAKLVRISNESFCLPSAISCLSDKCLAVADHGSGSVLLLDRDLNTSKKISGIKPFGVAYSDVSKILYVTDRKSRTVLLYDSTTADKRASWCSDSFGWICSAAVLNETGNSEQLAVLDRSTSSIKLCDAESGYPIVQFGSYGNDDDQFCMSEFMTWDPRRECLLVSDSGNHRVVAFDPRQGSPCFKFGHRGSGDDGSLQWPKGICVDQNSNIYVADSFNKRVSKFTADGCFIEHLISPINAPYTLTIETNDFENRKSKCESFLNLTTFSLQNKAQLFRYSI